MSGTVRFGDPVQANVTLKSEAIGGAQIPPVVADEKGSFTFPKVPPGPYTLKARSVDAINGNRRSAEMKITVPQPPKQLAPITVNLKW